jgi:hypothetical protein
MLRVTFWHAPQYFQFYFRDPEAHYHASLEVAKELESMGVAILPGAVLIRTLSEYSEVPITVVESDPSRYTNLIQAGTAIWSKPV